MRGCVSLVIYLIVSGCYQGPEASSQLDNLKLIASKASQQFMHCILGHTQIGLNIGGCVNLVIYLIVSGCCVGPEASSKLDHLKLRASKASQKYIQCIFGIS